MSGPREGTSSGSAPSPRASFALLTAVTVLMFAGFTLLLPVVPVQLVKLGGTPVSAAAATTVFMLTTVATQLGVPALLRHRGHRWVIVAGGVLLGAPALGQPALGSVAAVLGTTALRGCGFGMLTVAAGALVAELVPPRRLGRATGIYGLASGAPQLITLPLGLAVAAQHGTSPVLLAGGALPLVGALLALRLPAHTAATAGPAPPRLPVPAVAAPVLAMVVVAVSFGATVTNLALAVPERAGTVGAALSVLTGAMLVGRLVAGPLAERIRVPERVLPAGVLLAAAGAAVLAVAVHAPSAASLVVGAGVFGTGFGLVQNDSLVTMFAIAGPARFGPASAAWNMAYDAGTGAGSLLLGSVVALAGYSAGFAVTAATVGVIGTSLLLTQRSATDHPEQRAQG